MILRFNPNNYRLQKHELEVKIFAELPRKENHQNSFRPSGRPTVPRNASNFHSTERSWHTGQSRVHAQWPGTWLLSWSVTARPRYPLRCFRWLAWSGRPMVERGREAGLPAGSPAWWPSMSGPLRLTARREFRNRKPSSPFALTPPTTVRHRQFA